MWMSKSPSQNFGDTRPGASDVRIPLERGSHLHKVTMARTTMASDDRMESILSIKLEKAMQLFCSPIEYF